MSNEVFIQDNNQSVLTNATVTSNGSTVLTGYGFQQIVLVVNVKSAPTGTSPTLIFTIQEVDPGDKSTAFGNSASTQSIITTGIFTASLSNSTSGTIKISWTIAGAGASFTNVYATVVSKSTSSTTSTSSTNGFAYGTITTTAVTSVPLRASTYNEQTTGAQRSISSSSGNDTSGGTGAKTVTITYYDSTGAGPNTETVTMNGATAVNTTNTNICFIEKIVVATVGTGGSNAGTLTLFIGTGGTGGTLATVNAGDNQTLWAHHYVSSTKTCYVTGLTGNNSSSSNTTLFLLKAKNPTSATAPEIQISDTLNNGGATSQAERTYGTPLKVAGPSRIILYGAPAGTPSITSRGSFDFYEQ